MRKIDNTSNDWRTDTENPIINTFRELMIESNEYVDEPSI